MQQLAPLASRRSFIAGSLAVLGSIAGVGRVAGRQGETPLRLAGPVSGLPSLDPTLAREIQTNYLLGQVFRGLVTLDANLLPAPGLASAIEAFDDGQRYRFTLRPGITFQDGRAIHAEDVAASLTRALDPSIAGGDPNGLASRTYIGDIVGADEVLAGTASALAGVKVLADDQLEIRLAAPSATFLGRLTNVSTAIVDVQQAASDPDWQRQPNGSGPYRVTDWQADSHLELQAVETWWAGTPSISTVTVRLGANAIAPLNLYQAGEIDLIPSVFREEVPLARDPASGISFGQLIETTQFSTSYIALGNQVPPLDDLHVRRALQLVFPVERYALGQFGDTVVPATGLVPPGMLGEDWLAVVPAPDAEAATAELARSRYGSPEAVPPIEIYAADVGPVEALRAAAATIGLDVRVYEVVFADFVQGLAERRFPSYAIYWSADYPDPASFLDMLFRSSSPDNYTGYINAEFDDLLAESSRSVGADRISVLSQANQLLVDDAAVISLYYPLGFALAREGIAPLDVSPLGLAGLETIRWAE